MARLYEIPRAELLNIGDIQDYYTENYDISRLKTVADLTKYIYAVDKKTGMSLELFNVDKLLKINVKINKSMTEPKVLIFHTHGNEMYSDSKDITEGVIGAGNYLTDLLENKYNVKTLHITRLFDMENGAVNRNGAYERMEPYIAEVLRKNPSVELVIDLHRDGVNQGIHLVKNIEGKPCAKFMLFNGLCKKWDRGQLVNTEGLSNPYLENNLALSLKMQLEADKKYPGITRKIYLNAYRYSLHFKPNSMLIELGAQTNTKEEAFNSIEIIAQLINDVVLHS